MNYQILDTDTISFENRIFVHTLSKQELGETIDENILLKDAVLMLINPEYCKDADLYFDSTQSVKEWLKEMFQTTNGFNKDFITKVFTQNTIQ